jgi:hypothetical protein
MKLFIFLLGIVVGAAGYHYYHLPACVAQSHPAEKTSGTVPSDTSTSPDNRSVTEKARDGAHAAKEGISQKLVEWHLTPAEIDEDLKKTGRVVRNKTASASQTLNNTRTIAVIRGKYALEDDLSTRTITVEVDSGKVTLRGTVKSPDLIAKAIAIALATDGVTSVDSHLTVSTQ